MVLGGMPRDMEMLSIDWEYKFGQEWFPRPKKSALMDIIAKNRMGDDQQDANTTKVRK